MDQTKTPLFSGLLEHVKQNPVPFHIPGHKKGEGMNPEFRQFIGANALSIDLTSMAPLDDLHHPRGIILEAEKLAAKAFGADYTFFSVQGTSGAIMAMVMAVCGPGDKIIIPRNAHKSVMSAIILAGAHPIFIHPVMDKKLGISNGMTTDAVREALRCHPDAKAVLAINPTYFGISSHIADIVTIAHEHHVPVLVDEAHGVHFHFHEDLPISAMDARADLAATSVHKCGGSLTQTSVLNVREGLVSADRVKTTLSILTTTSPSYILLASLDAARQQLAIHGHKMMTKAMHLAETARTELNRIPGLYCVGREILGRPGIYGMDLTKLIIHVWGLGITGYDVEKWLRENYRIEVELSDMYNILCIVTLGDNDKTIGRLIEAMRHLSQDFYMLQSLRPITVHLPKIPDLAITPRQAFYSNASVIPLTESVGWIIAEFIMIYPPGIPILIPGEVITQENIDYILKNLEAGLFVQGPEDESMIMVRVVHRHSVG